jgi:hypothetical protein
MAFHPPMALPLRQRARFTSGERRPGHSPRKGLPEVRRREALSLPAQGSDKRQLRRRWGYPWRLRCIAIATAATVPTQLLQWTRNLRARELALLHVRVASISLGQRKHDDRQAQRR